MKTVIFGAGCFWGVEEGFRAIDGVISTEVGYIGGNTKNPSYKDVCTDKTGHAEAVKIVYDEERLSYDKLLEFFFEMHDPTQVNRQGPDVGTQYRSAIFYTDDEQRESANEMIKFLDNSGKFKSKIATEVTKSTEFYPAEDYHQKYLFKRGMSSCHIHQ